MNLLRRHPWILLVLLSLVGAAASLTMVWIASQNPTETVPVDGPADLPRP